MFISTVTLKDDEKEEIEVYSVDDVVLPDRLTFANKSRGKKKPHYYAQRFGTIDTETSHAGETDGWIYQWAVNFDGLFIAGRKPSELMQLFHKFIDAFALADDREIIFYIHNLSYDAQYLKQYILAEFPDAKFLCTDTHSMLSITFGGVHLLDSYRLSNMGLDLFARTYAEKYRKAVGEINYNIVRYQDTDLTVSDWDYMLSDVASQHDAIKGLLKSNGYKFAYQAPITSTGFVRADCLKASRKQALWRREFQRGALDVKMYDLMRQSFMGGITEVSWKYAEKTIRGNIGHKDFASSYPARIMMDYFPKGKPMWFGDIKDVNVFKTLLKKYCCIFVLTLNGVRLKQGITAPYIPSSKCIELDNPLKDNGKIVYADHMTIVINEIDFRWIRKQYTFDTIKVSSLLYFERGAAPKFLRDETMKYYRDKCELKYDNTEDGQRLYAASKAKLNSIYGMTATALVRYEFHMDRSGVIMPGAEKERSRAEILEDYYFNRYTAFLPYQYGCYVTAHARSALMQMIEAVGYDNFYYCDTDSVFYRSTPETEKALEEMNAKIRERAKEFGAYVDDFILGEATDEPPIRAFRSLHAKCYVCEEWDKKKNDYVLKATIAGVPKKSIKWIDGKPVTMTNAEELGSIDNLKEGFTFHHCGGTRTIYVEDEIHTKTINGHITELASSAIIENIDKEISNSVFTAESKYLPVHVKYVTAEI